MYFGGIVRLFRMKVTIGDVIQVFKDRCKHSRRRSIFLSVIALLIILIAD